MLLFDTIVAPATAPGLGGVGIVRLSGPESVALLGLVFCGKTRSDEMSSHHLYYGHVITPTKEKVDEVLAVVMRNPRSYTGEDVVEVHCHGGSQIMRSVVDLFLNAGARMATPGEFTQRAFLNGRMDLAQAEAVMELIGARSERASRVALGQLDGVLSRKIHQFSERLKNSLALLEAHIDFPEDEVGVLDMPTLTDGLKSVSLEMAALASSFDVGRVLREGICVLILGRPNVGKSSLMNALLGESRAIVTPIAGTTRDTLEEQLVLAGFPVRLIDAAGVRHTDDLVEMDGVRRATEKAASADLVLVVVDGSCPANDEDFMVFDLCQPEKTVLVVNKSDQELLIEPSDVSRFPFQVTVSAKHSLGLDGLRDAIVERLTGDLSLSGNEGLVVTERRHRDALLLAIRALDKVFVSIDQTAPYECVAIDMREALDALGSITGQTTPDDILDHIFGSFCIGK